MAEPNKLLLVCRMADGKLWRKNDEKNIKKIIRIIVGIISRNHKYDSCIGYHPGLYLYKAKRVSNRKWVKGYLVKSFTGICYIVTEYDGILDTMEYYEVDENTIRQIGNIPNGKSNGYNSGLYLYKAKSAGNEEWMEGYLIKSFAGIYYIVKNFDPILNTIEYCEVDENTIRQIGDIPNSKSNND